MTKKILIISIIVLVLGVSAYFIVKKGKKEEGAPAEEEGAPAEESPIQGDPTIVDGGRVTVDGGFESVSDQYDLSALSD